VGDFEGFEPFLDDARVGRISEEILNTYPALPEGTFLVTFVTEGFRRRDPLTGDMRHYSFPPRANFAIVSDNPRAVFYPIVPGQSAPQFMSVASVYVSEFQERDLSRVRFVGAPDPAMGIFKIVLAEHLSKLDTLRNLTPPTSRAN